MAQLTWLDSLNAVLNSETPVNELTLHLESMQACFASALGNRIDTLSKEWTRLQTGKATSPADAVNCFSDTLRTVKYIRGGYQAIQDLQKIFPNERLHVVYAGCGPFAPLMLPLCALFTPDKLSLTLIDIHRESLDSVKLLARSLDLESSIKEYLCEDASLYRFPEEVPIHMMVSETLVQGLIIEGHVSIVHNFSDQILENGIIIPETIIVDAKYIRPEVEFQPCPPLLPPGIAGPRSRAVQSQRITMGRVFDVSLEAAGTWKESACHDVNNHVILPANTLDTPEDIPAGYEFALFTELKIYKDIVLREYESGLTHPLITNFQPLDGGKRLAFCYAVNDEPSLCVLEKGELYSLTAPII